MTFRYEKHKRKGKCPKCNQNYCFRYIEDENGNRLSEEYGKCDRANNCGYVNLPSGQKISSITSREQIENKYISDISAYSYVIASPLYMFLSSMFPKRDIMYLFKFYNIGYAPYKGTIFWMTDIDGRISNGKIIRYNTNGKRDKNYNPYYYKRIDEGYQKHLTNLHLVNKYDKYVVVESEKTAFICNLFFKDVLFLGAGGANCICDLIHLNKGKILLIPDYDVAGRTAFLDKNNYYKSCNYKINLLDLYPERNDTEDIADDFLRKDIPTIRHIIKRINDSFAEL